MRSELSSLRSSARIQETFGITHTHSSGHNASPSFTDDMGPLSSGVRNDGFSFTPSPDRSRNRSGPRDHQRISELEFQNEGLRTTIIQMRQMSENQSQQPHGTSSSSGWFHYLFEI